MKFALITLAVCLSVASLTEAFDLPQINYCINVQCNGTDVLTSKKCCKNRIYWNDCIVTCLNDPDVKPYSCLKVQDFDPLLKKFELLSKDYCKNIS